MDNLQLFYEDFLSTSTAHTRHVSMILMVKGCLKISLDLHTQSVMINHSICCAFCGHAMMTDVMIHTITEQQ
jgi:hypothetical protein